MNDCMLCGKHPVVGQNIRHIHSGKWKFRAPRTKRSFKPNLQKMTIEGVKILVCTGCMKTLAKPVVVKTPKEVAA